MDRQRPRRAGFTLIELLMVIVIIAALIAILVPTVGAAFRRAKEAQVAAEMNNLATALASFKNTYGEYPPSRVILCESGYGSLPAAFLADTVGGSSSPTELPLADPNCTDMTNQALVLRSLNYLRKFWPRADFTNNLGSTPGSFNDFDGDGKLNSSPIVLTGSECLAFFLGGVPIRNAGKITGLTGFSRNPRYPFVDSLTATNRTVPNYEFNAGRLVDQDGDHIPSYIDPINTNPGVRRPYAYFVSYGTNAYDPNDNNGSGHSFSPIYEPYDTSLPNVEASFLAGFPVVNGSQKAPTPANLVTSPAPNPYTNGPATSGNVSWISPNSYQLISAGQDGLYGPGGTYNGNGGGTGKLPNDASTMGDRLTESDNVTSFSGGRLD